MSRVSRDRWQALWTRLGSAADHDALFTEIYVAYADRRRAYHNLKHLEHCLAELDAHAPEALSADEIELALWFHDAVYSAFSSDNEEKSAEWARRAVTEAGLPSDLGERVAQLILATRHAALPAEPDQRLMVDIDLAILGSLRGKYDRYERAVRREYKWVPWVVYRRKRAEILQSFLDRDSVFLTLSFRDLYEKRARKNLARSIARLERGDS